MSIKMLSKDEFNEVTYCTPVCELSLSVNEVERLLNIDFFHYIEDGLGDCFGSYISIEDGYFFLQGFIDKNRSSPGVTINIRSYEPNPLKIIDRIMSRLNLTTKDLNWFNNELKRPKWIVSKINEEGNKSELYRFQNESIAKTYTKMNDPNLIVDFLN